MGGNDISAPPFPPAGLWGLRFRQVTAKVDGLYRSFYFECPSASDLNIWMRSITAAKVAPTKQTAARAFCRPKMHARSIPVLRRFWSSRAGSLVHPSPSRQHR